MCNTQLVDKLFKIECNNCKRDKDLCWTCYNKLIDDSDYQQIKNVCELLYQTTKQYLDVDFRAKFRADVPARLFEMIVCKFLLSQPNLTVESGGISRDIGGPDFKIINKDGSVMYIEVAVANYPSMYKERLATEGWINQDLRQVRISSLIRDKYHQREGWIKKIENRNVRIDFENSPFIIAIAPAMKMINVGLMEDSDMLGSIMPIGHPAIRVNQEGTIEGSEYGRKDALEKISSDGKTVMIFDAFFTNNESYTAISGVLFSRINYTSIDRVLDDTKLQRCFVLAKNPKARIPLSDILCVKHIMT